MKTDFWYQKNIITFLLYPFSFIYRLIIFIRRTLFTFNVLKSYRVSAPVIIVGNITVGGTGKTPLVIAIANALQEKGLRPGIILRGYRGKNKAWPVIVTKNSDPVQVGDEAVLLAKKTNAIVIAGPDRVLDAQFAIEKGCNVIVSDDGLQHYRLKRDVEIAVVDGDAKFGNGFCLPAGPLREPVSRLKKVDFVVMNESMVSKLSKRQDVLERSSRGPTGGWVLRVRARPGAQVLKPTLMQFVINAFVNVIDHAKTTSIDDLKNKKIIALAAIGNPNRFFECLRALGLTFKTRVFPDHYFFQEKDLRCASDEVIVMTEKDAVKCAVIAHEKCWMACGEIIVDESLIARCFAIINAYPTGGA